MQRSTHWPIRVEDRGNWSGGGRAVLCNLRLACDLFPQRLVFGTGGSNALIPRNVVPKALLQSGKYFLMPQNSWPWQGPWGSPTEAIRKALLRTASELALNRAQGVVRISASIPVRNPNSSVPLANVLDAGFEQALRDANFSGRHERQAVRNAIVCIGDVYSYRNVGRLIEGYSRYRAGGGRCALVIAGKCPSKTLTAALRRQANRTRGVSLQLRTMTRSEVLTMLQHASGIIFPSLAEASPITLLEALCVNDRIVVSNIPAHLELAGSRLPGCHFFKPSSVDALANALVTLDDGEADQSQPDLASPAVRADLRIDWATRLVELLEAVVALGNDEPSPNQAV